MIKTFKSVKEVIENNIALMAFSKGKESVENPISFKKYYGVANVKLLTVNPNAKELAELYGREVGDKGPEYLTTDENGVKKLRLDFYVKTDERHTDADGKPLDIISKYTLFLSGAERWKSDRTKVQVIDKYGRTAWVTPEQYAKHEIPVYTNGPANIDADYRAAYIGEEDLTNLFITHLNIASCMKYVDGKWVMEDASKLADCEARFNLDDIKTLTETGNVAKLREYISYQPLNTIKVVFFIKNVNDKQYMNIMTSPIWKGEYKQTSKIEATLKSLQEQGKMSNGEYNLGALKEYVVTSTQFVATSDNVNPQSADEELPF